MIMADRIVEDMFSMAESMGKGNIDVEAIKPYINEKLQEIKK